MQIDALALIRSHGALAVALDFVLSMDELIYESLAPARAKAILRQMGGFKLRPNATWSGIDLRSAAMLLFIGAALAWAAVEFMHDQLDTLHQVRAAICYGDQSFVYATDGAGVVNFGYPPFHSVAQPIGQWETEPAAGLSCEPAGTRIIAVAQPRGSRFGTAG